jgi:predicted negative regulator of RcsB-dependent stress response
MANQLDLEEQEQLAELKHFWNQYGNLINAVLIVVLLAVAGWNLYQYWQRSQAIQAAALYDEVERVARAGDTTRLDRVLSDMKDKFASTIYAQQASLLAAKVYVDAGKQDAAKAALTWVAEKSSDVGYQGIARLRLAGMLLDAKAYDEALKQLSGTFAPELAALVADRRGDVFLAQGKNTEAGAEYLKAFNGLEEGNEYRRLVDVKLAALGLNPRAGSTTDRIEEKK